MYSLYYKRYFIIGNVVVAFSIAVQFILIILFEIYNIKQSSLQVNASFINIVLYYALFAFIINLIREIIKDIEDIEGDRKCGCKTIPIVMGILKTKIILSILIFILIILLVLVLYRLSYLFIVAVYLSIFMILPLLYLLYRTLYATHKFEYSYSSKISKIIMLLGILSMFLFEINK